MKLAGAQGEGGGGTAKGVAAGGGAGGPGGGLGDASRFDFITAEGVDAFGKNPGQSIQPGSRKAYDDLNNKRQKTGENEKAPDLNARLKEYKEAEAQSAKDSDLILDPVSYDQGRTSMRPQFIIGGEDHVRMTGVERMKMDVQFDVFDFVPEGYGLGAHNKLFIHEKGHERGVRFAEPLFDPRMPDGRENGIFTGEPMYQFDTPYTHSGILGVMASEMNDMSNMASAVKRQKVRSVDTLADDNNNLPSAKGLTGRKPSPFEPVIMTRSPFIPTVDPAGCDMKRQLKGIFNTQRTPMKMTEYNPNNGFPTMSKSMTANIILP